MNLSYELSLRAASHSFNVYCPVIKLSHFSGPFAWNEKLPLPWWLYRGDSSKCVNEGIVILNTLSANFKEKGTKFLASIVIKHYHIKHFTLKISNLYRPKIIRFQMGAQLLRHWIFSIINSLVGLIDNILRTFILFSIWHFSWPINV